MRRTTRVLVGLTAAATLLLAGCGSGSSSDGSASGSPDSSPSSSASVTPTEWTGDSVPKVSGTYGDKPTLTFGSAPAPETLQRTVLSEGTGPKVESGQLIAVDYLGQVYGGKVFDNSYDRKQPAAFGIDLGQVIAGWDATLVGMKAGSRVLISVPPAEGYGASGQPDAGISGTDTLVFVIDIIQSFGKDVAGQADATKVADPPAGFTVGGELGKVPTIAVAEGTAKPSRTVTTVLAKGSGAPLPEGLGVFQYVAVDWTNTPVESTWTTTPAGAPVSKDGKTGIFDTLVGVPVGSRVLLQLPAGSNGGPYAVVVDIIAHVPTAKQSLTM